MFSYTKYGGIWGYWLLDIVFGIGCSTDLVVCQPLHIVPKGLRTPIYSGQSNIQINKYPQPVHNSISQSENRCSRRCLNSLVRLSETLYIGAMSSFEIAKQGVYSIGIVLFYRWLYIGWWSISFIPPKIVQTLDQNIPIPRT